MTDIPVQLPPDEYTLDNYPPLRQFALTIPRRVKSSFHLMLLWIHITYTINKLNNRSFSLVQVIRTCLPLGLVGVTLPHIRRTII